MIGSVWKLAQAEFQEGLRNRWVLAAVAILATLAFALALLGAAPIGETRASALSVTTVSLASLSIYLIPLIALTLSFDAIVGEHERGTLLLLLTYPVARWQVICGKFFGHAAILACAILFGYGSVGVYFAVQGEATNAAWWQYGALMVSTLMLGTVFIALGYLLSVTVSARATAAGAAIGLWLVLVVVYDLILLGIILLDGEQRFSAAMLEILILLNPADVYRLYNLAGSEAAGMVAGTSGLLESSVIGPRGLLAILMLWVVLPLGLSVLIFQRREL